MVSNEESNFSSVLVSAEMLGLCWLLELNLRLAIGDLSNAASSFELICVGKDELMVYYGNYSNGYYALEPLS